MVVVEGRDCSSLRKRPYSDDSDEVVYLDSAIVYTAQSCTLDISQAPVRTVEDVRGSSIAN